MARVQLNNISKSWGDAVGVKQMSLDIADGEFLVLLGPSGCGKTTTMRMVAGLEDPSTGEVWIGDRCVNQLEPKDRDVAMVFQSYGLYPNMTVAENISFPLRIRGMPVAQIKPAVLKAAAQVELTDFLDRRPKELSGGQRQRVALARALVIEPPVLLLDEPLSNLDAKLREEMQFELRHIQRKVGTTTIMVTHDQTEAMSISDRVVVMQAGRVTQIDAPLTLYEQPQTRFISDFVGKANVLAGRVTADARQVLIDPLAQPLPLDATGLLPGAALVLSLRPERIHFTAAGQGLLDGRVSARFFLGSQWLYRLDTAVGELMVLRPNGEAPALNEGSDTGLAWSGAALRVLP
jgi:putative spermidine/putrescine transport system ATP-binding protein